MLLENKPDLKNVLHGKTVLLTGAGGGIGFEAAKAFAYMGAKIIIAEINCEKGVNAENHINNHFENKLAEYYEIDLSDEQQICTMAEFIMRKYGCIDVIFNNATVTKMGAIDEVDVAFWDKSYAVNLKAPLLLTQKFLPIMKEQNSGTIVFVSSSGASPYMGAYEVFKTAQVELCNTLAMELEGKNVYSFTIGPGLAKTETAMNAIEIVAKDMGMSTDEFYAMNRDHIIDVESAGVGFAMSVLNAEKYNGQEIGSIQVLMDYDLISDKDDTGSGAISGLTDDDLQNAKELLERIQDTFEQQYAGWRAMNIFERQWVLRDLKKTMGLSAEQVSDKLRMITQEGKSNISIVNEQYFFEKLCEYWKHQLQLLQGYEKDKKKLTENTQIINGWIEDISNLLRYTK
ncbi:SDR family NAD(P)-dependent oxidoreductase [uncultured Clostridium sp.]|uniref:SDR family NAD(P)-dependent oxidoreductase n=1 Tax=uncultured Clostridium sp. TaxID=59620 RepID=UPI0028ED2362|nr:SDR family NAD(P)-dependent oxidoreductase [uncultured Clostridium sp.]